MIDLVFRIELVNLRIKNPNSAVKLIKNKAKTKTLIYRQIERLISALELRDANQYPNLASHH